MDCKAFWYLVVVYEYLIFVLVLLSCSHQSRLVIQENQKGFKGVDIKIH